jgi:hypothetical protein
MVSKEVSEVILALSSDLQDALIFEGIQLSRLSLTILEYANQERRPDYIRLLLLRSLALKAEEDLAPIEQLFPSNGLGDALMASLVSLANERPMMLFLGALALVAQSIIGSIYLARHFLH